MTNRKSHTPFRLVPESTTLVDLEQMNSHYTLCFKMHAFGTHHENLNEIEHTSLSAAKCSPMTVVSGNVRCVRIFAEVPCMERGRQTSVGCCRKRQLSVGKFRSLFLQMLYALELRPTLLLVPRPLSSDCKICDLE